MADAKRVSHENDKGLKHGSSVLLLISLPLSPPDPEAYIYIASCHSASQTESPLHSYQQVETIFLPILQASQYPQLHLGMTNDPINDTHDVVDDHSSSTGPLSVTFVTYHEQDSFYNGSVFATACRIAFRAAESAGYYVKSLMRKFNKHLGEHAVQLPWDDEPHPDQSDCGGGSSGRSGRTFGDKITISLRKNREKESSQSSPSTRFCVGSGNSNDDTVWLKLKRKCGIPGEPRGYTRISSVSNPLTIQRHSASEKLDEFMSRSGLCPPQYTLARYIDLSGRACMCSVSL